MVQKTRTFVLPPAVSQLLGQYARHVQGDRLFPLTRQRVYRIVREIAERAGYGGMIMQSAEQARAHYLHPHNFREAFATHWFEKRDDTLGQKALQTLLGHERFETTARYAKMTPQRVQDVYNDVMGIEAGDTPLRPGREVAGGREGVEDEPVRPAPKPRPRSRPRTSAKSLGVSHTASPPPKTVAEIRAWLRARREQA